MGIDRDGCAMRLRIHIGEHISGNRDVARHTAFHIRHDAVQLDRAAEAGEGAVPHRARPGLDQQPLIVVLPVAVLNSPAGTGMIGPLDDGVREPCH